MCIVLSIKLRKCTWRFVIMQSPVWWITFYFGKKTNKQKNIENAVIYCIHIPLSQLITADCKFRREKWFNIRGNRSIVTRYRLDSQFHCSYQESREVAWKIAGNTGGKNPGNTGKKRREIISLSFPVHDFRWRHFRWCNFRWRHCSTLIHHKY